MVCMTLEQRNRFRALTAAGLLLVVFLTLLFRFRIAPMAERLIETQVDNQASAAINAAIRDRLAEGEIGYDRMVDLEKDAQGNVTAIRSNIGEINRLKTELLLSVDGALENLSTEELAIPAGSIFLPELFAGGGPEIPVRVLAARTSDAAFRNSFTDAGINQTLHSIFIDVHVNITVLTWTGTQEIAVTSSVVVAETVIVGAVPATYLGLEGLS